MNKKAKSVCFCITDLPLSVCKPFERCQGEEVNVEVEKYWVEHVAM